MKKPMFCRRALLAAWLAFVATPAVTQEKLPVVASFSIIGDLVKNVGGDRIALTTLVGPNGDAHVYTATPADAKNVAAAKVVFVNGLGFEGWIDRLAKASGSKVPLVTVTRGIKTQRMADGDDHGQSRKHSHGSVDPHAWQSVANTKVYVDNIRDALVNADPDGKAVYDANSQAYLDKLDALEGDIRAAIEGIDKSRRRVITSHEAFGYFEAAYGIDFIAPQGVSTESEASAQDVARLIRQIRAQKIPAVFLENISDARLVKRIAIETGAKIGGTLYSDALSGANGPAPTYLDMMRHNVREIARALGQ
jgi:zinc/manganese transport system substrate-binding protein